MNVVIEICTAYWKICNTCTCPSLTVSIEVNDRLLKDYNLRPPGWIGPRILRKWTDPPCCPLWALCSSSRVHVTWIWRWKPACLRARFFKCLKKKRLVAGSIPVKFVKVLSHAHLISFVVTSKRASRSRDPPFTVCPRPHSRVCYLGFDVRGFFSTAAHSCPRGFYPEV